MKGGATPRPPAAVSNQPCCHIPHGSSIRVRIKQSGYDSGISHSLGGVVTCLKKRALTKSLCVSTSACGSAVSLTNVSVHSQTHRQTGTHISSKLLLSM